MHMRHHVTNHLIISNDKDSNSENRIKLRVRDNVFGSFMLKYVLKYMFSDYIYPILFHARCVCKPTQITLPLDLT
jgi:hypothetical protein